MRDIVIFEDGKIGRGSKAKLIKRGNKRVLIEFFIYDYDTNSYKKTVQWFKLYASPWCKTNKHNNKRKKAKYCHDDSNEFYTDERQTEEFKSSLKEWVKPDYFNSLYG